MSGGHAQRRLTVTSLALATLVSLLPGKAWAQACCAGTGALTPGRLARYEDALVGLQLHAASVLGSFDDTTHFAPLASGSSEYDLEQDLFGALRIFKRAQVALLVPFVETRRQAHGLADFGGGIGDVNLSARYDSFLAGESRVIPGVAALFGVTAPTGTPPESASGPLAAGATGVGAWQANLGLALEQVYGHWLVNATELVAWRAARSVEGVEERLGPQLVTLLGTAYTFDNEAAVALFGSYTLEGSATLEGASAPASARHLALVSLSGLYPLSDAWRLQGALFLNPPVSPLGRNQTAAGGLTLTVIRSWS